MSVQGIIEGFADPSNTQRHAAVVGRGASYQLVIDGKTAANETDMGFALDRMFDYLRENGTPEWLRVSGIEHSSVGQSRVTALTSFCLDEALEARSEPEYARETA